MHYLHFLLLAPLAAAQNKNPPAAGAFTLACCKIDKLTKAPGFIVTDDSNYTDVCCGRYEYVKSKKTVCSRPSFLRVVYDMKVNPSKCITPQSTDFQNCCIASGERAEKYITCIGDAACLPYNIQCGKDKIPAGPRV